MVYRVCFSDPATKGCRVNFVHKKFGNAKVAILQDTGNDYKGWRMHEKNLHWQNQLEQFCRLVNTTNQKTDSKQS